MWWWISGAFAVFIYLSLFFIFGLGCIQKSRWLWFVLGFFFPILWIIGAVRKTTAGPQPT